MYLDACVLVKLFVREPDSEACAMTAAGSPLVSSELAYAEMASSLLRKERSGHITQAERERSWLEFERALKDETLWLAPLDGAIVRQAQSVMLQLHQRVPLRTLDALHLATYLSIVSGPLFTKDAQMMAAAKFLELPLCS